MTLAAVSALKMSATVLTFAGAATACVLASASYPVAIWAVGYGVIHKNQLLRQQAAIEVATAKER